MSFKFKIPAAKFRKRKKICLLRVYSRRNGVDKRQCSLYIKAAKKGGGKLPPPH